MKENLIMDNKFLLIALITLIVLMVVTLLWGICTGIVFANNKLYCKHYLKKDWNLWEEVIEKLRVHKGTIYVSRFDDMPHLDAFEVKLDIASEECRLIYWVKKKTVSLHKGTDCLLSGFDKYHSGIAMGLMEEKINRALENSDENVRKEVEEIADAGEW